MGKKLIVFIDFDGTISREDICFSMVEKFAAEGWQDINRLWEQGILSTEECAQQTLDLMQVSPEELERFFAAKKIDESFPGFIQWLWDNVFPVYIISDGYDNYIELVCKKYGINLPYYANHLDYEDGWHIKCCHLDSECRKCGVCKTGIIKKLAGPDYVTVYIGDGYSDICPAGVCDIVFAKKTLAKLCQEQNMQYYSYENFQDVKQTLEELLNE